MRPGEVLDAQGDLLERLDDSQFRTVMDALAEFEFGRSGGDRHDFQKNEDTPLASMLATGLKAAYAYRVTHDMSMMVEHASMGLDGLDRFDHSLAPTGCGFVAFDRPMPVQDMRGKTMLIHYLVWGPVGLNLVSGSRRTGTLMVAFNDTWRQPDQVQDTFYEGVLDHFIEEVGEKDAHQIVESHRRTMGRWATVGASVFTDDQRLGPALSLPNEEDQARLIAEGDTPVPGTNVIRYLHALWLMMGQTVARVEPEEPDRPSRRRAVKRKLPPKVTVIKLRRETGGSQRQHGESDVEWAHRWVVRGHWRWQAVSERHHLAQEIEPGKFRARIWINPFVKGPESAPFRQSDKVYSLER